MDCWFYIYSTIIIIMSKLINGDMLHNRPQL
jgi:hypothetical protein